MGRECISPHILNSAALLKRKEPTVPNELGTWWAPELVELSENFPQPEIKSWTVKPAA
jgi:hypothetical protein